MIKTTITLPEALLNQVNVLAQRLDISQDQLFQIALEQFIESHQDATPRIGDKPSIINQGDVYWLQFEESTGIQPEIRHPYVVVQENVFNHSRIHTVVVCALTSNLKRGSYPGNVLLEANEANLPKPSVVEVSKVSTVEKTQLGEYVGSLSERRIDQILAGMRFLQSSFFDR